MSTKHHLRLAQRHECHELATIGAASFVDDPHDAYIYPNRKDHPEEYVQIYRRAIEDAIHEELSWVVVAEGSQGEVMGYAIYTRKTAERRKVRRDLRFAGLESSCMDILLASRLTHRIRTLCIVDAIHARCNPVVDRHRQKTLWNEFESQQSNAHPPEYWYLQEVAVEPSHRFQGVGKALLEWGQDWATREDLPMLLQATRPGRRLFQRAGFVNYGVWRWGEGEQMSWDLMRWTPSDTDNTKISVRCLKGKLRAS
jgi:GNAT superfamily N-acetyltransferase